MSDNVIPLNANGVSPEDVLVNVMARLEEISNIHVVVKLHNGCFAVWASGDLKYMSDAALLLTRIATDVVVEKQEEFGE